MPVIAVMGQPLWSNGMAALIFVGPALPGVLFLLAALFARRHQTIWRCLTIASVVILFGWSIACGWGFSDFIPTHVRLLWESNMPGYHAIILSGQIVRVILSFFAVLFVVLLIRRKPNQAFHEPSEPAPGADSSSREG